MKNLDFEFTCLKNYWKKEEATNLEQQELHEKEEKELGGKQSDAETFEFRC